MTQAFLCRGQGDDMRYLVAGSSGMIGRPLVRYLADAGHEVRCLVRSGNMSLGEENRITDTISWNPEAGEIPSDAVEWADAMISLNGTSLSALPWTSARRRAIMASRVQSTSVLAQAIADSRNPPDVWVSGSAAGFYGSRPGEILDEDSVRGKGFLADTVTAWEAATSAAHKRSRVVCARTGIVLGQGGALIPIIRLTRLFLGGTIGPGTQYWPWISLGDEVRALAHLAQSELEGPVNLVGPVFASARDITRLVAKALGRPHALVVPSWVLRFALGDAAKDLLLADQRVVCARLSSDEAFEFRHPTAEGAVAAVFKEF